MLDSSGGSVFGAIALGREIRALNLATVVGRVREQIARDGHVRRAWVSPRAECQSMCPFVLLAGVKRYIPPEARVLVHQIWLGDRRDDAAAAVYSAEDLVLVRHDIGRLVQYTLANGIVGADLVKSFGDAPADSITVRTSSATAVGTPIRIGNTGFAHAFPQLVAACGALPARIGASRTIGPQSSKSKW